LGLRNRRGVTSEASQRRHKRIRSARQQAFQCGALVALVDVSIRMQGERDRAVTEAFGHHVGMHTGGEELGRV
jgi:hypothetical protein